MGYVTTFTASGQGSLSLGGVQGVNEIAWNVITPADQAQIHGVSPVRRFYRQGAWALTFLATAGPMTGLTLRRMSGWVDYESASLLIDSSNYVQADTLYWDIEAGGLMYFEVDWP